jgi:CTP synthase (UTP-ammonia lyase)
LKPASRLRAIYGAPTAVEGYHCRYGLSSRSAERLASGPLQATGRDAEGDVRAVELYGHPFFFATLYQPERSALDERRHPLIEAFVIAASASAAILAPCERHRRHHIDWHTAVDKPSA